MIWGAACVALEQQGPVFVLEPAARVEFSAHGSGVVKVEWLLADGSPALPVELPPFPADRLRHDVHSALYRCRASNHLGTILSRDVHVRAVVRQQYEVQVYDEYVISGAADGSVSIYPNTDTGGKYAVLGDLYVYDAGPGDAYKSYACRTVHQLTGEVHASVYPGRIVVSEPKGPVQPRITVDKHSAKLVRVGDDVTLACVAQGYPVPSYRWYREQLLPVAVGQRLSLVAPGSSGVVDRGKYLCWVNNSAGEETVQVALTVTAPLSAHLYQCFVSNEWEQAQATAQLLLGDASPDLVYWFSEQTLQPGPAVSLKCVATGIPPPQFVWTLDGFPVPDNNRFLVGRYVTVHDDVNISSLREEDGGEYTCTARNAVAQVSHSNHRGRPSADVQVGTQRAAAAVARRLDEYSASLVIEHISSAHSGDYTCIAQNVAGTVTFTVPLTVNVPPRWVIEPSDASVASGHDTWCCTARPTATLCPT
ncbi:cell adhesion molecule Dscam2-like [Cloeon dipterum]|uniref:cell adhesion molecule Dscam2-like n=1 Tax=Cloeon dipterum TaxID=197152 RepID=UPI0032204EF3